MIYVIVIQKTSRIFNVSRSFIYIIRESVSFIDLVSFDFLGHIFISNLVPGFDSNYLSLSHSFSSITSTWRYFIFLV